MKKIIVVLLLLLFNLIPVIASANAMEGTMTNPLNGTLEVTSPFGYRFHPIKETWIFHSGVDLGADYDDPVFAAAAGTITYAGWISGYGNAVIIDHLDNVQTLYGHNELVLVSEGETVQQGQEIANAGSTGNSTGPHCHFEVRVNGEPVDPANYLIGLPPSSGSGFDYKTDEDFVPVNFNAYYDFAKPIRDAIKTFGNACTKGLGLIRDQLSWLFFALITIDLALSATGLLLDGFDSSNIGLIKWLFLKILFYGFLTFMFLHWGDLFVNTIREYFVSMGAIAMGKTEAEAAKIISDPTEIVQIGAAYVGPIFTYLGSLWGPRVLFHLPTVIVSLVTAFAVLGCFFMIGIEIALAYIEFYCTALFGFIGFTFVACKGTREYSANAINGIFASAIKLMVFSVVALIISTALHESVPTDYFDTETVNSSANGGNFADVQQFAAAIKRVETGGCSDPYNTPSEDGYGFGAYQISYSNWNNWCAEAGIDNPPDMPWPADIQDRVALQHMQTLYGMYGSWESVARVWNTGSPNAGDGYWLKVSNGGGTSVEKTLSIIVLLKMFLVAFAAMVFGHADGKTILREFGTKGFRFKQQGIRSMKL